MNFELEITATTASSLDRTILGPLTTTFTPPPSCNFVYMSPTSGLTGYLVPFIGRMAMSCVLDDGEFMYPRHDASCWPPAPGASGSTFLTLMKNEAVYSPGLLCPAGYSKAWVGTPGNGAVPLASDETAIGCCPSGFTTTVQIYFTTSGNYAVKTFLLCSSTVPTETVIKVGKCDDSGELVGSELTYTLPLVTIKTGGASYTSTLDAHFEVFAPMIPYVWRTEDLETSRTATATATATAKSNSVSTGTGSLSPGAAAGIGMAGLSALIALVALGTWAFMRKRKQRRSDDEPTTSQPPFPNSEAEIPKAELSGDGRLEAHELQTMRQSQELDGCRGGVGVLSSGVCERPPVELEG